MDLPVSENEPDQLSTDGVTLVKCVELEDDFCWNGSTVMTVCSAQLQSWGLTVLHILFLSLLFVRPTFLVSEAYSIMHHVLAQNHNMSRKTLNYLDITYNLVVELTVLHILLVYLRKKVCNFFLILN